MKHEYDILSFDKIVDDLLSKYDKPYRYDSLDPSVDILKMAEGHGLKPPRFVSSKQKLSFFEADGTRTEGSISGKHAVIECDGTIVINEKDEGNDSQCRFNIAHELSHVLLGHVKLPAKDDIEKYHDLNKKLSDCGIILVLPVLAARDNPNFLSKIFSSLKNRDEEEDADHLAANLLVPVYRFQFWEDKTDEEIAKAFKVELKCIKKRRNEIGYELNELIAAMKPCSIQEKADSKAKLGVAS